MANAFELRHDLIVIGASAGGVEALKRIVAKLPEDLRAAILVVLHLGLKGPSFLPEILNAVGPLTAVHPLDRETLRYGRIYVAPPDYNLVVEPGMVRLTRGPNENRHRPAVDPLFQSAAEVYGPLVVACILTGALDDGTAGAIAVRRHGGTIIAQDPADAMHAGMPSSVIDHVTVDYVLPLSRIAPKLIALAASGGGTRVAAPFEKGEAARK